MAKVWRLSFSSWIWCPEGDNNVLFPACSRFFEEEHKVMILTANYSSPFFKYCETCVALRSSGHRISIACFTIFLVDECFPDMLEMGVIIETLFLIPLEFKLCTILLIYLLCYSKWFTFFMTLTSIQKQYKNRSAAWFLLDPATVYMWSFSALAVLDMWMNLYAKKRSPSPHPFIFSVNLLSLSHKSSGGESFCWFYFAQFRGYIDKFYRY